MKNHIRLFAFVLALIMALTFSGCSPSGIQQAGSLPSTGSTPATSPSSITYEEAHIAELITKLEKAHTDAGTNYEEAMAVLSEDFDNKLGEENEAAFTAIKNGMDSALAERQNAISGLISLLQTCDPNQVAQNADKIAEAESMLANKEHRFGDAICHSRNAEGTLCTDMDYYQICSECNLLQWSKGGHSWYYNRTESDHQNCCRNCSATETAAAHNLTDGKCDTCSYVVNANILVIEGTKGESAKLCNTIGSKHTVTVVNAADSATLPASVEALQAYHEVILCNVANADLPAGFAELLQIYVRDFGGSLFTVGGDKAYQLEDMGGTTYEELLPVEMTVPSMAVMIIVDTSGSMWYPGTEEPYETSKLFAAVQGAEACLDVLCENDYVGVMSLGDYYTETIELTPRTQRAQIIDAINSIELGSGTIFEGALVTARRALLSNTQVDKRHIIIITDGLPGDADPDMYLNVARQNAKDGITMSVVGLQCDNYAKRHMRELVKAGGMNEKHFYDVQELSQVANVMRESMAAPELRDIQCQRYMPSIVIDNSITENLTVENMPVLDGAYYSKLKEGATEVLGSPYGPLYAQWNYGKGMVGSFMCDLNGTWSAEFLEDETGKDILNNIILELANPPENPEDSPKDIF